MKKYLKFLIVAICFTLVYKVLSYSTYGAPSEFGNASLTTCYIGGDLGVVNCTGNISTTSGIFVGDGTGLTGLSSLVGNCSGDGVCAAILYYSGLSALDFYNGSLVNDSITKHNASMKSYVDAQNVIQNTSLKSFINTSIQTNLTSYNSSIFNYINSQDTIFNTSMVTHDKSTNVSMKAYVDAQDHTDHGDGGNCNVGEYPLGVDANGAVQSCTDASTEIIAANTSLKTYVDTQDSAQDACNEITNCVDNAWDANIDIDADEISESKINFVTSCSAGDFYRLTGNDLECTTPTDTNTQINNCSVGGSCSNIAYDTELIENCSAANSCANILYETELDDESELEAQLGDVSDVFTNNDGTLGNTTLEIEGVCWANVTRGEWIIPSYVIDIDDEDIETDLNTYVDIGGDSMTGDLNSDGTINATNITGTNFYSSNGSQGITSSSYRLCTKPDCQDSICYQETANISTACGGLETGNYSCSGGWHASFGCDLVFDGSYSTAGVADASDAHLFINYTKPQYSVSASLWQIKNEIELLNLSIAPDCFNQSILQFKLTSKTSDISIFYCMNDTDWEILRTAGVGSGSVYEEAVFWDMPGSCQVHINDGLITGCT